MTESYATIIRKNASSLVNRGKEIPQSYVAVGGFFRVENDMFFSARGCVVAQFMHVNDCNEKKLRQVMLAKPSLSSNVGLIRAPVNQDPDNDKHDGENCPYRCERKHELQPLAVGNATHRQNAHQNT